MSFHNWASKSNKAEKHTDDDDEEEEEDPVDTMLNKTGCSDQHYAVQECMFNHRDWRKCQNEVKLFRECMAKNSQNKTKWNMDLTVGNVNFTSDAASSWNEKPDKWWKTWCMAMVLWTKYHMCLKVDSVNHTSEFFVVLKLVICFLLS